jgi:hypothetical protein
VRPLLLAIQRCPAYRVVVVNRRRGWLFSIEGTQVSTAALPPAEGMRDHGFSGWHGLQAHRANERIIQLARHHYHDTAVLLERAVQADGAEPVIIGGHQDTIPQFLGVLPARLRDQFAGCFVADPHTLTPAKVRARADRVIRDWRDLQDQRIAAEFVRQPPDGRTATGLSACLAAAGQHAIQLLLVPAGGLVPGYACRRCGALSSTGDGCPHGASEAVAVPDLIEELAVATLGDGGQVETLPDPPGGIAARLRHPLRLMGYTALALDTPVIDIDGSAHSGSGTIVRHAAACVALTGQPVRVRNAGPGATTLANACCLSGLRLVRLARKSGAITGESAGVAAGTRANVP